MARTAFGTVTITDVLDGTPGERGSRHFYGTVTNGTWSDTKANAIIAGEGLSKTLYDKVTLSDLASKFSETRYWNSSWIKIDQVIDGNLIVDGTLTIRGTVLDESNTLNSSNTAESVGADPAGTAQAKVDGLAIGGVNLFENSEVAKIDRIVTNGNEYGNVNIQHVMDKLEVGEKITISFDVLQLDGGTSGPSRLQLYCSNHRSDKAFVAKTIENLAGTGWSRQSFTTTVYSSTPKGTGDTHLEAYSYYGTGDYYHVKNIKIERGDKATDWSPAPEDEKYKKAGTVAGWNIDGSHMWTGNKQTSSGFSSSGITLDKDGAIRAPKFRLEADGDAYFRGTINIGGSEFSEQTGITASDVGAETPSGAQSKANTAQANAAADAQAKADAAEAAAIAAADTAAQAKADAAEVRAKAYADGEVTKAEQAAIAAADAKANAAEVNAKAYADGIAPVIFGVRSAGYNGTANQPDGLYSDAGISNAAGTVLHSAGRGISVAIVDKTTRTVDSFTTYDTYGDTGARARLVSDVGAYTQSDNVVIAVVNQDEAANYIDGDAAFFDLMVDLGATEPALAKAYGSERGVASSPTWCSYLLIGEPGLGEGNGYEQVIWEAVTRSSSHNWLEAFISISVEGQCSVGGGRFEDESKYRLINRADKTEGTVAGWNIDGSYIWTGTKKTSNGYTSSGVTLSSGGAIRAPKFRLDTDGNAHFLGGITGSDITGATISGATITGGTVQTATTGKRVVLTNSDDLLTLYNQDNEAVFGTDVDSSGNVELFFKGKLRNNTIDDSQFFTSAGISHLRGRLGMIEPSTPTGGTISYGTSSSMTGDFQITGSGDANRIFSGGNVMTMSLQAGGSYTYSSTSGDHTSATTPQFTVQFYKRTSSDGTTWGSWVAEGALKTITGYKSSRYIDFGGEPGHTNRWNITVGCSINVSEPVGTVDGTYYQVRAVVAQTAGRDEIDSSINSSLSSFIADEPANGSIAAHRHNWSDLDGTPIDDTSTYRQYLGKNSSSSDWVRTTANGIIPHRSGGASSLGTSLWPFNSIYGTDIYDSGVLLENKYAALSHSHAWSNITDKPSTFTPSTHNHTSLTDITSLTFGPGAASNDGAHIEWLGASNAGYLRISTWDDNGSEYIQFGDYDTSAKTSTFTQWLKMYRGQAQFTGNVSASTFTGALSGNASTASKWATARTNTVTLTGDATGSGNASVDGTGNWTVTIPVDVKTYKGASNNYVASSSSTANRGNFGAGIWAYSGYSTGSNRPFTYDATLQVMPTSNMGFEISADWRSQTRTPLKVRSLRDCCQGWSNWINIFTDEHHPNADKWTTARTHTVNLTGEVTGAASQSVDGTGNRTWNISTTIAAPASPSITSTQVIGETIELIFTPSSTSNVDSYEVWSDNATGIFSLIANIPPQDFGSSMSVIDNTFEVGTVNYRVYAIKGGNYSTPATTSRAFSAPTLDVTNLAVIPTVQTFEVGYDIPDSRFVDHVEIYVDIEAVQANLSRTGAALVYSGLRDNFTYNVSAANKDNYHQFWVEVAQ